MVKITIIGSTRFGPYEILAMPEKLEGEDHDKNARIAFETKFKKAIEEVMEEQGITSDYLLKEHNKVIKQDKHLPSKISGLDMAYRLKGSYAPDKKLNITANYKDIEAVKQKEQQLLNELKQLEKESRDTPGA